jgi:hypothetical protein
MHFVHCYHTLQRASDTQFARNCSLLAGKQRQHCWKIHEHRLHTKSM